MKPLTVAAGIAGALAVLAVPVVIWGKNRRAAGGDPEIAATVAMMVSENGIHAGDAAQLAVAEVFARNARRAQKTPRQVLRGDGGPLAPWPTWRRYQALMARSRLQLAADDARARVLAGIARKARESESVPGGTNWTHGTAPLERWITKGYQVVASFGVPSSRRPYLWIYRAP